MPGENCFFPMMRIRSVDSAESAQKLLFFNCWLGEPFGRGV
jgi:hypothetical protein